MNAFLLEAPETEEDVELLLESKPRFLRMPDGKRLMLWLPRVVRQAEAFAMVSGFEEQHLVAWALEQRERTGLPFEFTYPFIVYCAAHKVADGAQDA